jgi:uncharacterized protein
MAVPESQAEIAAFLQGMTGRAPAETHISAVFVGADDVFKLKKAVRLPFLDFSTLAARRHMTQRELALNRMAAPGIYKDVQAITRGAGGALHLAPADAAGALDYVVRMARVPENDFLDRITREGRLTPALLDALGDAVAALHARLTPVQGWDSPGGMRGIMLGNEEAARAAGLDTDLVAQWTSAVLAELEHIAPALAMRAANGFVRRAHGDLHLGNMCLWQGVPTAFDVLEFDEALATIDLGYDLAFLLMDLEFHADRAASNRVMNRYLARTGDHGLLALLPCFLSVRAMVRAHVQASRGQLAEAARYLRVALDTLRRSAPVLVAIGGLQGTGKTTLARALAPSLGRAPGAFLVRSDELRKRIFGAAPEEKLPPAAYGAGANARVNAALLDAAEAGLQAGQAVVLDSTFLHAPLRHQAEVLARGAGVPFLGIWLEAALETLIQRVERRTGDASDADAAVVRQAAGTDPGHMTWQRVPAEDAGRALESVRRTLDELPAQGRSAAAGENTHLGAGERSSGNGHGDGE